MPRSRSSVNGAAFAPLASPTQTLRTPSTGAKKAIRDPSGDTVPIVLSGLPNSRCRGTSSTLIGLLSRRVSEAAGKHNRQGAPANERGTVSLSCGPPGDAPGCSGRRSVRHYPSAALARAHYVEESSDRPGGAVPGLDQDPHDATVAGALADGLTRPGRGTRHVIEICHRGTRARHDRPGGAIPGLDQRPTADSAAGVVSNGFARPGRDTGHPI